MAKCITDLPNEMLDAIFSFLEKKTDLRAVSETSVRFNAVVEKHLYHTVSFNYFRDPERSRRSRSNDYSTWCPDANLPRVVVNIIQKPDRASFIKRAAFTFVHDLVYDATKPPGPERWSPDKRIGTHYDLITREEFEASVKGWRFTGVGKNMEALVQEALLDRVDLSAFWVLLLFLTEKLEVLKWTFPRVNRNSDIWVTIFNTATKVSGPLILPKLRRLEVYGTSGEEPTSDWIPLAPSMKEFEIPTYIRGHQLGPLLQRLPQLSSLELGDIDVCCDSTPERSMSSLMTVAATLERLTIGRAQDTPFLKLKEFPKLRYLSAPVTNLVYIGRPLHSQPELSTLLPPNLEELTLKFHEYQNSLGKFSRFKEELDLLKQRLISQHFPSFKFLGLITFAHPWRGIFASHWDGRKDRKEHRYCRDPLRVKPLHYLDAIIDTLDAAACRDALESCGIDFQLDMLDSGGYVSEYLVLPDHVAARFKDGERLVVPRPDDAEGRIILDPRSENSEGSQNGDGEGEDGFVEPD